MFRRPHHQHIAKALHSLDSDFLNEADCFFGGGTAIALALDEYRESADIDFMCASEDGYRLLRRRVHDGGFTALLRDTASVRSLRDLRTDQYGIRTVIEVDGEPIKFEIVREGRVHLAGAMHVGFGVPTLLKKDLFCEKLLANTDRYADRAFLSRDIIDLSMMIAGWGPIPEQAWEKARKPYGELVDVAYRKAVTAIRDRAWLERCMTSMGMSPDLAETVLAPHGGALPVGPEDDHTLGFRNGWRGYTP